MKNILLATVAAPALLYALPLQAQTCTAAPSCTDMGYTKTAANCTGKTFTRCPFDLTKYSCADTAAKLDCAALGYIDKKEYCLGNFVTCPDNDAAVRCLLDAKPGDLKYSLRTTNHDGWLLCNGTSYDRAMYPELYVAIGDLFNGKLPNYVGYFLKGAAATTTSTFATAEAAGLPNITGYGPAMDDYMVDYTTLSGAFYGSTTSTAYDATSSHSGERTRLMFSASRSNSIYGKSTTVTPQNYKANIFIFAGRKMSGHSTCEKAGYYDSVPSGQACTETGGLNKCYKDCKPQNLLEFCQSKNPGASFGSSVGEYSGSYCYDYHYDNCGISSTPLVPSDVNGAACAVYANQLVSTCTLDSSCMSSEFGITS